MLIRFSVENFLSFRQRQELLLAATSRLKDGTEALVPVTDGGIDLLRAVAIYGANASGKSNVLRALSFVPWAVGESQTKWKPELPIPRRQFLLAPECRNQPSSFALDVLIQGTRYEYAFALNDQRVVHERLAAFPNGRRQLWYERDNNAFEFGKNLLGENRAIQALTRDNSLFLSAAAQNNHKQLLPIYTWFTTRFSFVNKHTRAARLAASIEMSRDPKYKSLMVELLRSADLGIVDIQVKEESPPPEFKRVFDAISTALSKELGRGLEDTVGGIVPDKIREASLLHQGHAGDPVPLPLDQESDGTECLLALGGDVIKRLLEGGILCIDELDLSLHPVLALQIVKWFMTPSRNRGNAQLIFNTHNTSLLSERILRRDQIWFTEKDDEGATTLYPLTDFRPRRNESLEAGYLQGRFGAIPFVNEPHIWEQADGPQSE